MASEYLMKKYQDVKPDAPKELTKQEKRNNWLYYHRIHFVIAAVLIVLGIGFVKDVFMKTEPDYMIGFSSYAPLDDEIEMAIEARMAELGEDLNGDGKVVVQLNNFVINPDDPLSYTVQISLMGDLSVGQSDYFLIDDPVKFQSEYGVLTMSDGSMFDEGMDPELCIRYALDDCSAFDDIETGQKLYLTRRQFVKEEDIELHKAADGLWETMIAGAEPSAE